MRLWLSEKPDQGRRLAQVLGGVGRERTHIDTPNGTVTWAFGHLLELAEPASYDPALQKWELGPLPFLPPRFERVPRSEPYAKAQLGKIGELLLGTTEVVIATDADREGELIAREILQHFRYRGAIRRLWLTALDPASIRKAIETIRPASQTLGLAQAATARSIADWCIGLNATRIVSLRARAGTRGEPLSVGRVQTPTLALVVRRDREIEQFQPSNFYELEAVVSTAAGTLRMRHAPSERMTSEPVAKRLAGATLNGQGPIRLTVSEQVRRPPLPFALSDLQAAADRELGWPASKTLKVAQDLYEAALLTYPRTDCPYLPESQSGDIPRILAAMRQDPHLTGEVDRLGVPCVHGWIWNTAKVTAHHGIIPTCSAEGLPELDAEHQALYGLVAIRFLQVLSADRVDEVTLAEVSVTALGRPVSFRARRARPTELGWSTFALELPENDGEQADDGAAWPALHDGMPACLPRVEVVTRVTTPPAYYTEGTLIADMRAIAKFVSEPALQAVLKEQAGIGTEATRADMLKTLKTRGYLLRKGRRISSTLLGQALIDDLPPILSDPALTAVWEQHMAEIEHGQATLMSFLEPVLTFVREIGESLKASEFPNLTAALKAGPRVEKAKATGRSGRKRPPVVRTSSSRPTDPMLALARDIADQVKERIPPEVLEDFALCRAWIDQRKPKRQPGPNGEVPPSDGQIKFAESLAKKRGWIVPPSARVSAKECSTFIDEARK